MALYLLDQSGNGNDLTNVNGVTENMTDSPFAASTAVADFESSSTQYLTAPNQSYIQLSTTVSLESWVKPESFNTNNTIIGKGRANGDASGNYFMRLGLLGNVSFVYAACGPTFHTCTTTLPQSSTGTWTHLAFTFTFGTGSSMLCYVNGSSVGGSWVQGDGNSAPATNTEVLQLGCIHSVSGADELYDGLMDEVRIWNTIRTGTEINNNMSVEIQPQIGLVAYYPYESTIIVGPVNVKTWDGLSLASVKTINGLAIASVKTINGLN